MSAFVRIYIWSECVYIYIYIKRKLSVWSNILFNMKGKKICICEPITEKILYKYMHWINQLMYECAYERSSVGTYRLARQDKGLLFLKVCIFVWKQYVLKKIIADSWKDYKVIWTIHSFISEISEIRNKWIINELNSDIAKSQVQKKDKIYPGFQNVSDILISYENSRL